MWTIVYYDRFTAFEEKYATEAAAFAAAEAAYCDDGIVIYDPNGQVVYSRKCWGQFW